MEETEMAQPDEGKEAPDRETTSLPESSVPTATPTMQLPTIETNGQPRMSNTPVNNQDLQDPDNAPRVGMCFQSEEEAYQFYNSYAQTKGFSIRKCHLKYRADQSICSRYFVCNKAGVKTSNPTRVAKKEQAISRTNCMARVQFSITPEGIWSAQKVMLDHNHQLVSPDKRHMLRSQRQLLDADRHMIKQMRTSVAFNPATLEISCSCKLYGCVGILCKHAHKVFTCCNIIILPSQYISNRWTKYAKQEIFTSKPNSNDSLESMFAHTSRKMISLALKCKTSKEVLTHLNNGIDKLALEALELLSNLNLGEDEDSESSSEMTEYVAKTTVPFRAPERIKGSKQKRSKDVLEGAKKSKKKGKGTNYPAKESVFVPSAAGPSEFDFAGALNPSIAMAFGEYPSFLGPPIQGEFTRLLLEAHGDGTTPPAARQLDFKRWC